VLRGEGFAHGSTAIRARLGLLAARGLNYQLSGAYAIGARALEAAPAFVLPDKRPELGNRPKRASSCHSSMQELVVTSDAPPGSTRACFHARREPNG
jgi:hypothetical protein